jgi:hypothetical protein
VEYKEGKGLGDRRVIKSDPYVSFEGCMEFRLTYDGILLGASRTNTRADHKHVIRRSFHRQLKRLWATNSTLKQLGYWEAATSPFIPNYSLAEQTADRHAMGKFRFLPLATRELDLIVGLEILFLRYDQPGKTLIQSGDIDNRLKTLFDALRKPRDLAEICGDPGEDENPFYVLLEDDSLITSLAVTTDLLLEPDKDVNDVRLIISVKTGATVLTRTNLGFGNIVERV